MRAWLVTSLSLLALGCYNLRMAVPLPALATTDSASADDSDAPKSQLAWATRAGGAAGDWTGWLGVSPDGGLLLAGSFANEMSFGDVTEPALTLQAAAQPGLTSSPGTFLARYGPDGQVAWARQLMTSSNPGSASLDGQVFADGTALLVGNFGSSNRLMPVVVFDPAGTVPISVLAKSTSDIFAARVATDGAVRWVVSAGGAGADAALGVAADDAGGFVVTGYFSETAVFGEGEALETELPKAADGNQALFLARYEADGTLRWARTASGIASAGTAVGLAADGSIAVGGVFAGEVVFGPGQTAETRLTGLSSSTNDVFLARYTADGELVWARRDGGGLHDQPQRLAVDVDGSCLVAGWFERQATFGAGEPGATTLSTNGETVAGFVAAYAANGALKWAIQTSGTGASYITDLTQLDDGSFLLCGLFSGELVLGQGEAYETRLNAPSRGAFVALFSTEGSLRWARQEAGGEQSDVVASRLASPATGAVVVSGLLYGPQGMTLGAGEAGATRLTSAGFYDAWLARYTW